MIGNTSLFKEDAERLALQIQDEEPSVEIRGIRMDPAVGGYVIEAFDTISGDTFLVDDYQTWVERRGEVYESRAHDLVLESVHTKHGKSVAKLKGEWVEIPADDWPDHICALVERLERPGDAVTDIEPRLADVDFVEPGHGAPDDYSVDGEYLVLMAPEPVRVWRRITRMANFTLVDQSQLVGEWRELGFDIVPDPVAPMVEPASSNWTEEGVLEELHDRLMDISEKGFEAILLDGLTNVTAYAWFIASMLGMKVVMSWEQSEEIGDASSSRLGYRVMLHYSEVQQALPDVTA